MSGERSNRSGDDARTVLLAVPAGPDADTELDLVHIVRTLWHGKWTLIAAVFVITALAIGLSYTVTPTYSATVLLSPVEEEGGSGLGSVSGQLAGIASLAGVTLSSGGSSEEAIATLRSRTFVEAFIDDNGIMPRLFEDKWDADAGDWQAEHRDDPPTLYEGYQRFAANVFSVSRNSDTGLVTVTIVWSVPVEARDWANGLVQLVNEQLRTDAIVEAEGSLQYLNEELGKTQVVELRQAIYRLVENQINTIMLANVREDFAFKVIDPAVVPNQRDKVAPRRFLYAFAGLVLGGLLGIALVFFRQVSSTGSEKREQAAGVA